MTIVTFRLDIAPMPAPRPRTRVIAMPGRKPLATIYSPKEYKDWQMVAAKALQKEPAPSVPIDGPCEVTILCCSARPKTTKLPAPKPDVDNYAKSVLDAITKDGRFWTDDSQVTTLHVAKTWSNSDEPAIYVTIEKAQ